MLLQGRTKLLRQHRRPILAALAIPNRDRARGEVHVLDPQGDAFMYPQPGTVHQFRHQSARALHERQHTPHLVPVQHQRYAVAPLNSLKPSHLPQGVAQDSVVQEHDRIQGP
jgi:hypothetical protein